jgi:hypothetical protein
MTGVWAGESRSSHILELYGKINAALGNLSRSEIEILKD